jgi:hypothetical protein
VLSAVLMGAGMWPLRARRQRRLSRARTTREDSAAAASVTVANVAMASVAVVSVAVVSVVAVLTERRSRTSWASAGGVKNPPSPLFLFFLRAWEAC